ncbi:hypothetical protein DACRYDRAFT_24817 [Dacryopinax primogenitus]|uniref:F-box domain-containing protein n=1 Tax=Dacryopinax primogenitus (strain DJM 731) TaxID=1858805 RepID=M5FS00_DACPD|nr:uncharacterized protein DACRYDRAFT_24817 [Dacryopinax primogenitus]EJT97874.1 hypothetical protein DACRYDRAFT_24817 [Dacryopinax primogenitus]
MDPLQQPEDRFARALEIPEVLDSICVHLDDRDLVNMACACKSFTDVCMRILWESPVFEGSPLVRMSRLFPDGVGKYLGEGLVSPFLCTARVSLNVRQAPGYADSINSVQAI